MTLGARKKNIWPKLKKPPKRQNKNKTPKGAFFLSRKRRMRRVGKGQSSGGVLRVVALQDGAEAAAAAAAAAAHEARGERMA